MKVKIDENQAKKIRNIQRKSEKKRVKMEKSEYNKIWQLLQELP